MPLTRRRMLVVSLGSALATAGAATWGTWGRRVVSRRGWALGSDVSMTVVGASEESARTALEAAFAELETVERVMSLYRPDSQVCRLNREKRLPDPHPCLREVLVAAESMSRLTSGAFDITVQPLWDLYAKCRHDGVLPTPLQIERARQAIDWRGVDVSAAGVSLRGFDQFITLNGIAQGYATDRALAALRSAGIQHALVNSGEIGSAGANEAALPWTTGIQHPRVPGAYASVIRLDGRCLATSGDYATTFSDDFSSNHVFDPRTGRSPRELASVSILAPTGLQADGLSTAAMVLGVERTLDLARSLPGVDAFLVLKSGATVQTPGFPTSLNA